MYTFTSILDVAVALSGYDDMACNETQLRAFHRAVWDAATYRAGRYEIEEAAVAEIARKMGVAE